MPCETSRAAWRVISTTAAHPWRSDRACLYARHAVAACTGGPSPPCRARWGRPVCPGQARPQRHSCRSLVALLVVLVRILGGRSMSLLDQLFDLGAVFDRRVDLE